MIESLLLNTLNPENDGKDKFGNTPLKAYWSAKPSTDETGLIRESPKRTDDKLGLKCFKRSPDLMGFKSSGTRETRTFAQPVWPSGWVQPHEPGGRWSHSWSGHMCFYLSILLPPSVSKKSIKKNPQH